jgi:hypothetical protein
MSASEFIEQLSTLPDAERQQTLRAILERLYPAETKSIERFMRRIEHPEIPEDVWEGFEEAEDGNGIEIRDEHFDNPPA